MSRYDIDWSLTRNWISGTLNRKNRFTVTFHLPEGDVSATSSTKHGAWAGAVLASRLILGYAVDTPNPYKEDA